MTDASAEQHIPVLFRGEYEREMESWFRRRFLILCGVYAIFELLGFMAFIMLRWAATPQSALRLSEADRAALQQGIEGLTLPATIASTVAHLTILGVFALVRTRRVETRDGLVHEATWMIVLLAGVSLVLESTATLLGATGLFNPAWSLFFWHVIACLVLPWTARESLRPMIPLMIAYGVAAFLLSRDAGIVIVQGGDIPIRWPWLQPALSTLLLPIVLAPGMVICWWRLTRHKRRFGRRMASQGFMEMRRELSQARKIHESLFPRPVKHEDVEFDLLYRPMRELGGDFVQAWTDPLDRFHVVVIDVTGHGLAAAMTVNRLAGELDRIRAENPLISPSAVLAGLNRYIYLTLSKHVIFGTAVAAQLDPHTGRLVVANAGHPAAVLRRRAGAIEARESTAFLLGAIAHTEFEVTEEVTYLQPGDTLILVTDGVVEARDRRGRVFSEGRLREACSRQPPPPRWSEFLATQIDQWSNGVLQDDLLIATIALSPTARIVPPRAAEFDGEEVIASRVLSIDGLPQPDFATGPGLAITSESGASIGSVGGRPGAARDPVLAAPVPESP